MTDRGISSYIEVEKVVDMTFMLEGSGQRVSNQQIRNCLSRCQVLNGSLDAVKLKKNTTFILQHSANCPPHEASCKSI